MVAPFDRSFTQPMSNPARSIIWKGPMANPLEMGSTHEAIVGRLKGIKGYHDLFAKAYGSEGIDIDRAAKAIASFERTVLSGNAPYDRYKNGDKTAMTPAQVNGMNVFFDKAKCDKCHEGANFTLNAYANLGVGTDKPEPDAGRFAVTHDSKDWGAFKTPTLREIGLQSGDIQQLVSGASGAAALPPAAAGSGGRSNQSQE